MTPINKSYINRCPFCGSKDIKVVLGRQWPGRMLMGICTNCRCCGGHGKTSKKTLNSWNKYSELVWSAHRATMNEERLWKSEYNRLPDGTIPLKDHDNGKPIPRTAGMLDSRQISNKPYRDWETDRKSTRLNSSHEIPSRMPSSA